MDSAKLSGTFRSSDWLSKATQNNTVLWRVSHSVFAVFASNGQNSDWRLFILGYTYYSGISGRFLAILIKRGAGLIRTFFEWDGLMIWLSQQEKREKCSQDGGLQSDVKMSNLNIVNIDTVWGCSGHTSNLLSQIMCFIWRVRIRLSTMFGAACHVLMESARLWNVSLLSARPLRVRAGDCSPGPWWASKLPN